MRLRRNRLIGSPANCGADGIFLARHQQFGTLQQLLTVRVLRTIKISIASLDITAKNFALRFTSGKDQRKVHSNFRGRNLSCRFRVELVEMWLQKRV